MKTSSTANHLDSLCASVACGKQSAREITELVAQFNLKEPEFRLLWCLRQGGPEINQKLLAALLGLSPAQISALVEGLESRGRITRLASTADRRACLWRISEDGTELLEQVVLATQTQSVAREENLSVPRRFSA